MLCDRIIVHGDLGTNGGGRLGNQMFQLAASIGLAVQNRCAWGLNSAPDRNNLVEHGFKLENTERINLDEYKPSSRVGIGKFDFDSTFFLNEPDGVFLLSGWLQCEKYFRHCRDMVLEEFSFKDEIYEWATNKKEELGDLPLCGIHVRRQDYVGHHMHPLQSFVYYDAGLDVVRDVCKDCNIVYFSDDPEWVGHNMIPRYGGVVSRGNKFQDLCLMSLCNHAIIANSTYSWWGAWLNRNKEKIVVSPSWWFHEGINLPTDDIHCEGWVVI